MSFAIFAANTFYIYAIILGLGVGVEVGVGLGVINYNTLQTVKTLIIKNLEKI